MHPRQRGRHVGQLDGHDTPNNGDGEVATYSFGYIDPSRLGHGHAMLAAGRYFA